MEELLRLMMLGSGQGSQSAPVGGQRVTPVAGGQMPPAEGPGRQWFPQVTDLGALMMGPNLSPARDTDQMRRLSEEGYMLSDPPPDDVDDGQKAMHYRDMQMIDQLMQMMQGRYGAPNPRDL